MPIEVKTNKYSCIMASVPAKISDAIKKHAFSSIDQKDIYYEGNESGMEPYTHVTVVYGLLTNDIDDIGDFLSKADIEIGDIGWFHKEEDGYHVLRFEVASKELERMYESIVSSVENVRTYREFIPHITVAYIKDGSDLQSIESKMSSLSNSIKGLKFRIDEYRFSSKDGACYDLLTGNDRKIAMRVASEMFNEMVANKITEI